MKIRNLLDSDLSELYKISDKVRADNVGDVIHIRALLEISNICYRNCDYCGLRAENANLTRYAMTEKEIEVLGKKSFDFGYKTLVIQSGENNFYRIDKLAETVNNLSNYGITVTLSLGELDYKHLKTLKEAGAKRYLLKFETADKQVYSKLHKGYTLDGRLDCLLAIKELGYEVGSGFLVGLPNENLDSVAQNLALIEKLQCDMAGIGVFIPHKDTPLKDLSCGSVQLTKKCVAITRILLPKCNIPITTSVGEFGDKYELFGGGANVIMQNITPNVFADNYCIYPKKRSLTDMQKDREKLVCDLINIGRKPI